MLSSKLILLCGGVYGMTAVIFGAFGAHALKARISVEMLAVLETGVRYQGLHAVVLLFLGLVATQSGDYVWRVAGTLTALGIFFFSFSLYALALGGPRWFGPITPLGGLLLIAAWAAIIWAAIKYEA